MEQRTTQPITTVSLDKEVKHRIALSRAFHAAAVQYAEEHELTTSQILWLAEDAHLWNVAFAIIQSSGADQIKDHDTAAYVLHERFDHSSHYLAEAIENLMNSGSPTAGSRDH